MTDRVIDIVDLSKRYDAVEALRGLTLRVPAGSICGLLGRNGAGKTTTIKVLLGMARPTSGKAAVFGLSADSAPESVAIRRRTGFVSDEKGLYDYLTVEEMIRFTASFFSNWSADLERKYLRAFDLPGDRKVKALSRGMRTKLALLLALCRQPELLILDEPTSGLDPAAIEEVLQTLVAHVSGQGMTVFFSSHQIAEVEQVSDRVAIIDRGRAVVEGALDDLREQYRRVQLVFNEMPPEPALQVPGVVRLRRDGRVMTVFSNGGADRVVDAAKAFHPISVDVAPVTLKDIFLENVTVEN